MSTSTRFIEVCKAKLNRAKVTQSEVMYNGSLTVDEEIMDELGVHQYEKVLVVNLDNGERFETYLIKGTRGSRIIGLNGGAAKLGKVGDTIGFVAFTLIEESMIKNFKPKVVQLDENGDIVRL